MGEPERRRRRLRPSHSPAPETPPEADPAAAGPPVVSAPVPSAPVSPAPSAPTSPTSPAPEAERRARPGVSSRPRPVPGDDREVERGLRGLVGSGSSQVSVGAALRARDAARPTEENLAEAEQTLAIVRRNWTPREELPRNR